MRAFIEKRIIALGRGAEEAKQNLYANLGAMREFENLLIELDKEEEDKPDVPDDSQESSL